MAELTPEEVVGAYLSALAARDFERARGYLSSGRFATRSPIAAFDDADEYVADISRVGPILERIERRRIFADGNEVCAIVNFVTRMDRRHVSPVAYLMHVEDGKIASIESFFDARGYDELFERGSRAQ